ncbi:hypothetical protein F5X97DRAFT_337677 [Nemania serpens]|nr:hypothetical protein F5X97DRAFT_337677 [Nemania serpens]
MKKLSISINRILYLSPQGCRSLAAVGNIYGGEYKKIDIGKYRQGLMRTLLKEDKDLFEKYALNDSIITLKHASQMEEFNLTVNKIGVPLTLSGIGYQVHSDILIANLITKITPKDARSTQLCKGGRNESFMYGIDRIKNEERS